MMLLPRYSYVLESRLWHILTEITATFSFNDWIYRHFLGILYISTKFIYSLKSKYANVLSFKWFGQPNLNLKRGCRSKVTHVLHLFYLQFSVNLWNNILSAIYEYFCVWLYSSIYVCCYHIKICQMDFQDLEESF